MPVHSSPAGVHVRLFSLATLLAIAACMVYGGLTVYEVVHDSFVAPAILSPDSDVVLASRLKLSELEVEAARSEAELEGIEADLSATDKTIQRLRQLQFRVAKADRWTNEITSQKSDAAASELTSLGDQRRLIGEMLDTERGLVSKAETDVDGGIISRSDYAREVQTFHQLELALLENDRATVQSQSAADEASLARRALAGNSGAPAMPEVLSREEQHVRLELEIVRLESDERAKLAQKRAIAQRLQTIDDLRAELRGRPTFLAVTRSVDVAFVPYTQLDGVEPGAQVYSCLWGLFFCKPVGTVAQLVPGEVILPDPWGNQARGQYAVLDLRDHEAAKAKTLRVRARPRQPTRADKPGETPISAR